MVGRAVNCEQHVTFSSVVLSVPFAPTLILLDCCKLVDRHLNGNARHRRKPDGGSGWVESRLLIGSVHRFFVVTQGRVLPLFRLAQPRCGPASPSELPADFSDAFAIASSIFESF